MANHIELKDFNTEEVLRIFGLQKYPLVDEHGRCVNCKARVRVYKHEMSKGLIKILAKFAAAVGRKGRNEIHLRHDMDGDLELNKVEYDSFQKLRYHALVAKVRKRPGYWLLTHLGSQFLHGKSTVPKIKYSYRNVIVGRTEEATDIHDIKNEPWWPKLSFEILPNDEVQLIKQLTLI